MTKKRGGGVHRRNTLIQKEKGSIHADTKKGRILTGQRNIGNWSRASASRHLKLKVTLGSGKKREVREVVAHVRKE